MTYEPRTDAGRDRLFSLGNAVQAVKTKMVDENPPVRAAVDAFNTAADWAGERSPLLGAAVRTAPAALGLLAGPGSAAAREAFSGLLGDVSAVTAPSRQAFKPLTYQLGALNDNGKNALSVVLKQYDAEGPKAASIPNAIDLTEPQRKALAEALAAQWGREFPTPASIGLKPKHGYESRILKDGYTSDDYLRWLISAADDSATVGVDYLGRPGLLNRFEDPVRNKSYQVKMPIRSDSAGQVYADDVIPMGLKPPKKK